ncbi:MAG: hypothetical protein K9M49_04965 [Candidatus Marinimicrobia bacterium]|nr:hypothetical protein [Candidatus Neomarinimicrobiota bacterium]MCF7850362.1 hypothetical protein [Candidatus Neomarinimicrobiota bacterium]MCF7904487.1 hypothetical protein [Candidatus Neomarinimicrobiota bacterium]
MNNSKFRPVITSAIGVLSMLFFYTCTEPPEDDRIILIEDLTKLSARVDYTEEAVVIDTSIQDSNLLGKPTIKPISLSLIAEVDPPVVNGQVLQATDVHILSAARVYVSYNMAGEEYLGAVDLFDVTDKDAPELVASLHFTDSDINGMARYNDELYLAIATNRDGFDSPAAVEVLDVGQKDLSITSETFDIPSFSATSVIVSDKQAFITSGADDGAVTVIDLQNKSEVFSYPVEDARWVDTDKQEIAVLAGTPARVLTFDYEEGTLIDEFNLSGATIPFSKSTIKVHKKKAVAAVGDGGTQIICLETGATIETIEPPIVDGLSPLVTVTNAAETDGKLIYISNGEAGVYVAYSADNFDSNSCNIEDLQMVGSFRFGDLESVNHIGLHGNWLYVAGGSGGLKILEIR